MNVSPEYVSARRVLLDALDALEPHLDNLVLVGAQAVYHHTGSQNLRVAPYTTDADLAVDTRSLGDVPEIGGALRDAGFIAGQHPGHWVNAGEVAVDLMVVPHQSGTPKAGARAARIARHDKAVARITDGLEPALVDNERVTISSLAPGDKRMFGLRVAGPAALLTAKAIKIGERLELADRQPDRLKQKDALDAFRLFQAIDTDVLVSGIVRHEAEPHAAASTRRALATYREHASSPNGKIAQLASAAALGDPTVAPSFAALVRELLTSLRH
ncbi:hypothetical protein ACQB6R_09760 [Propionibacteriaceae bacterium G1746]|uniref:hypothetical protein n=1 Tax=Aestuariimicrobium sp. G57 TaxID=3418485 RepID=UPI003C13B13A